MTKRISQPNTVVVPAVHADGVDGKVAATKTVVVPAEAEVASAKVEVKADEAPVTVVADPVAALVAPAPMAMVADQATTAEPAAASAPASQEDTGGSTTDLTPYIVGGVLVLGGVLAVALSSGDTDPIPVTPAPTNTAPSFTSGLTGTIAENAPVATIVYDANASDTQNNAIVFTIGGTDAGLFNIDASTGVVTLKASANFEAVPAKTSYSFTVTATDNGTPSLATTQTITVTLTNVNEAPTFATATATATTPENVPVATVVFQAQATDPDAVNQVSPFPAGSVIAGYTLGGADAGLFNISSTGAVTFKASPDFETPRSAAGTNVYTFTVTATDNAATPLTSTAQTVTVTVTDVPEVPVFTSGATATVAENAAIATVVYDANTVGAATFTLGGTDAAAFNIDATTGIVTLKAPANFEAKASYSISVTGTSAGGTTVQPVTVTVTNVNEAPAFAAATATVNVAENGAANAVVFTTSAADPDAGAVVTYSLTGADAAAFSINATTGAVSLTTPANFEVKPTYAVNVVATDNGNPALSASQALTVNITNVNEAPTFAAATRVAAIDENVAAGTVIPGSATATDVDAGSVLTYSLAGADAARFSINTTTGVVSIIASPDFETKAVYNFSVVATDNGNPALTGSQAVTLNINDLPEGIVLVGTQNLSAAGGNIQYTDSASTSNNSTITGFGQGDTITVDVATTNYTFQNTGTDLIISYAAPGGSTNQITLVNALPAGSFVFNEFTAEQAVGSNFFLQGANVPTPPAAANTIDGAGSSATYNAANAAVTFTDNAGTSNNTTINNFGTDDRIVVQGVSSGYNFQNNGADLTISFGPPGGATNQITLTNVVPAGVFVFNEASAEQAVGADFFRYG